MLVFYQCGFVNNAGFSTSVRGVEIFTAVRTISRSRRRRRTLKWSLDPKKWALHSNVEERGAARIH